jgi:hypothetical protein
MPEFKDKIGAAAGKVEYLYNPAQGISVKISASSRGFFAMYIVAVSLDGKRLLSEVPATGIGVSPVYPQPSVITYIQSDEQGMWGRNCPFCHKYFRTKHVMGITCCPYCSNAESGLAFVSKDQWTYITACYDAFARAHVQKKSAAVELADITDKTPAWHYSEEKQQFHFKCAEADCAAETDILGEYGYCPRCGRTNARKLFAEKTAKMLARVEHTEKTVLGPQAQAEIWEDMTKNCVSDFEALANHLRIKLLRFPMTANRRKKVEELSFQRPLQADESLEQWFDIGLLEWAGDQTTPKRKMSPSESQFVKEMFQKRHLFVHRGGIVDDDYLGRSGDTNVRLGERIGVRGWEVKRFVECLRMMAANFLDNVEFAFKEE